jgi:hypothetical protein
VVVVVVDCDFDLLTAVGADQRPASDRCGRGHDWCPRCWRGPVALLTLASVVDALPVVSVR